MSRSPITIDDEPISADPHDWLPNPHAGELLQKDFLDPLGLDATAIACLIGSSEARVAKVIEGTARIDAELDLRLGRYFGMSEGFFMRLQNAYELLEQRRALGEELDRIVPRAA